MGQDRRLHIGAFEAKNTEPATQAWDALDFRDPDIIRIHRRTANPSRVTLKKSYIRDGITNEKSEQEAP